MSRQNYCRKISNTELLEKFFKKIEQLIIFLNKKSLLPSVYVRLQLRGEVAMFFRVALLVLSMSCGRAYFNVPANLQDGSDARGVEPAEPSAEVIATALDSYETRQRLAWHFPCKEGGGWSLSEHDFIGQGVYSKNMHRTNALELTISGLLCDTRYLPRDVVFVIDTSASMRHNDPMTADGSCARSRAMDRMVAYLSRFDNARVGLVAYNSYVSVMHDQLVPATKFYADYMAIHTRMQEFLCYADFYTNYRRALLQTEELLNTGRTDSFREIYFFSDGEPRESLFSLENPAGLHIAKRLRKNATIATIGLGQTGILQENIASRVNGEPLHRQADKLDELFGLLRELVQTKNVSAELTYRYLGTEESYLIDISKETGAVENEFFQLDPLLFTIDADDPQKNKGIAIEIKYGDSNGNTYHASSELHFTFE